MFVALKVILLCLLISISFFSKCSLGKKLAAKKLEKLNVFPESLTVTGFSSGGAMAMMVHMSFSSKVHGAGIFSGVPYMYGWERKRDDFFVNDIEKFNTTFAIKSAESYSIIGSIDPVENLNNSKVYVYHGSKDSTVEPGSGSAIEEIYKYFGADLNCYINECEGEHGMPTENFGGPCGSVNLAHYLANDCKYMGAYEMYNHLYGPNLTRPLTGSVGTVPLNGDFYLFDQTDFLDNSVPHSMDRVGYVYVPSGCANKTCRISFVFHGCLQNRQLYGDKFPKSTGYLEVAELNDIVQVYPQTSKSYRKPRNPSGCWDWLGFSGNDYPTRFGHQTAAVGRIIDRAVSGL